ncbi:cation diffusion facilitator family transporter [Bartonella sp. LJL80]
MQLYDQNALAEQRILKYSIWVTIVLAVTAVSIGIFTGSSSIIFDGMYSAVDCVFSLAALLVARLIQIDVNRQKRKAPKFTERFQYGFWHFEPMLLAINGISLMIAVFYGLFESISTIWRGGHTPDFGPAVWFAFFAVCLCFGLAFYELRRNREIGSAFIAIDAKSWFVSGGISLALLCAFIFAFFIEGTEHSWLLPYIDPAVLALIAIVMIPVPVKTVIKALREILMITPVSLDNHVNAVVDEIVERYGFVGAQNYLAKVGRSTMIEIHLILPQNYQIGKVEELDKIRSEIGDMIGDAGPDRWLTVSFTAKPEWAY